MASDFTFIQTSQLRLDAELKKNREIQEPLRKALRNTFKEIISITAREKPDALLICGNLFATPQPAEETVGFVIKNLKSLKKTKVLITPGYLDPATKDSVYHRADWPKNTHVFTEDKFSSYCFENHKLKIYGFAHNQTVINKDPLLSYRPKKDNYKKVLMFTGSVSDYAVEFEENSASFRHKDLIELNMSYAALGGSNQIKSLKNAKRAIVACYSGSPQGLSFKESGDKGVLKITMADNKNNVIFLPTASYRFQIINVNCNGLKDTKELLKRLKIIVKERNIKYEPTKLILVGGIDTNQELDTEAIKEEISSDCFYIEIEDRTILGYDMEAIIGEKSTRGLFTRTLMERISNIPSDDAHKEELKITELALKYGLDAFSREEVSPRW